MSLPELLTRHLVLCEELHALALEENRILKLERRAPDAAWRERKQALASRFEASVADLKARTKVTGERGGNCWSGRGRNPCKSCIWTGKTSSSFSVAVSILRVWTSRCRLPRRGPLGHTGGQRRPAGRSRLLDAEGDPVAFGFLVRAGRHFDPLKGFQHGLVELCVARAGNDAHA